MLEMTDEVIEVQKDTKLDDEKKWCVYCHTNKINGKKYIGITSTTMERRWRNDGSGYRGQVYFWRAIQKYGWHNFDHEVLFENKSYEDACRLERQLIANFKSNMSQYGYNQTEGGDCNYAFSDEAIRKMSAAAKERYENSENHPWYGRHHSEESKEKIKNKLSGKMVGEKNPNYGNHKLAGENNPFYGKHHSDEVKEKLRQAHLGTKASEETKRKQREKKKGFKSIRANAVYCIELNEIFWGQQNVTEKYGFNRCCIGDCCRGKQRSAGKHPVTGDPLHWLYAFDFVNKDSSVIYGAITLGYITEEEVNNYLDDLKQKGND